MNDAYLEKARQNIVDPGVLSVICAKRAKQLARGARPMIKCDDENHLDIALLEIAEGKIEWDDTPGPDPEEVLKKELEEKPPII